LASGSYFLVAVRRRSAFERVNPTSRDPGYFIPFRQKRGFVCRGRIVKTTDLSCELPGSSSCVFSRDRRIKIEKASNVPAKCFLHLSLLTEVQVLSA
jgi:hypothetical protein